LEKPGEEWWSGVLKYLGYNGQELITVSRRTEEPVRIGP
jgi:hypothetical protein